MANPNASKLLHHSDGEAAAAAAGTAVKMPLTRQHSAVLEGRERAKDELRVLDTRSNKPAVSDSSDPGVKPSASFSNVTASLPYSSMQVDFVGVGEVLGGEEGAQNGMKVRDKGKRALRGPSKQEAMELRKEMEQPTTHGKIHLSWRDLFTTKTGLNTASAELSGGKRQKVGVLDLSFPSLGDRKRGWIMEDLSEFCKASAPSAPGKNSFKLSLSSEGVLDTVADYDRNGVVLYFMGRRPTGMQLKGWATKVLGLNAIEKFIFLGKGFFLAICNEPKFKFTLLDKGGAWGNGLFGMAMPWHLTFDPMGAFLKFCPVWVTFKEVPVFFLPHLTKIAEAMGKVLYIPTISQYVFSRNVKVCLLWDMDRAIPRYVEIDMEMEHTAYIELSFSSFPTACYKCKTVGHFAKECPLSTNMELEQQMKPSAGQILQLHGASSNQGQDIMADNNFVSLQDKSLFVDLQIESKNLHLGSGQKSDPPSLSFINKDPIMIEKSTSELVVNRKKHKKRKKKKTPTASNEDIRDEDEPVLLEQLKETTQDDTSMPERTSEERPETGKKVVDMDDGDKEDEELKEGEGEDEVNLDEISKDILAAVPTFLYPYYSLDDHMFYIPATVKKGDKKWVIEACGKRWNHNSFFKENNLSPKLVVLETPEGDIQWHGSLRED